MILLNKQFKNYENEINNIKNFMEINSQYYETQKQENITWAKNYDKELFEKISDKNDNSLFKCKICWHTIGKIPVYKETLHNDEYIKCPHCSTTRYLYPEKIAERLNNNLDIEFKQFNKQQLAKLKALELNYKSLREKSENKVAYYIEETNHKTD